VQSKLGADPEVPLVLPDDFPNESLGTSGKRGKIVGDIVPVRDISGDGLVATFGADC
jgi:hypothetical protein